MKLVIVATTVFLAVVIAVSASNVPSVEQGVKYADGEFLMKQKFFLEILRHIHMPLQYEEYKVYTKSWVEAETMYKNYDQVVEFFDMYKMDYFLKKGEIFTVYNKHMMKQIHLLFTFLYNSLNWDTYFKNVIWAREHINEGMFIYAITLTVMHRSDLQGIILPVIYEIYPYYFFNSDVIRTATYRKLYDPKFGFYGNQSYNVVYSNFTVPYPWEVSVKNTYMNNGETSMDYYTEDIGLNAFYFYFMMDSPFFFSNDRYGLLKERSGEVFLYIHKQFLTRYNLERFSNFMYPTKKLSWKFPLRNGYFSLLSYWNGIPFKSRDFNYMIKDDDYFKLDLIKDWEMRMRKMIDEGFYMMDDGTKIDLRKWESLDFIGKLINCNTDNALCSKFGFTDMMSKLLLTGMNFATTKTWPSVLMQYETTLRDPAFYKLWERLLDFYYQFKIYLPKYTVEELNFKGVVIRDATVDKLMTYFEYSDADISNAIPIVKTDKYWDFSILARTKRLNHKPYTYTLDVMSEFSGKGIIRVYLGPKFDRLNDLNYYKQFFLEIDEYVVDLAVGQNTFVRSSRDFMWSAKDRTKYTDLYRKTVLAMAGKDKFPLDGSEAHCKFPDRLMLPKGWTSGMKMQFYFIISPYTLKQNLAEMMMTFDPSVPCGKVTVADSLPMGFPLDREIDSTYFHTKNMFFKDVSIYHLDDLKVDQTD